MSPSERPPFTGFPDLAAGSLLARPDEALDPYLDAFATVVLRFGVQRTRAQDVAREAGIDRTTLFRHCGPMDEVLRLYLAREVHRFIADTATDMPLDLQGAALLVEVVARSIERIQAHPVLAKSIADEPEMLGALITEHLEELVHELVSALAVGISMLVGIGHVAEVDPDALAEWIARFGLTTLLAPPPPADLRHLLSVVLVPVLEPERPGAVMNGTYDLIIHGGRWFDGTGAASAIRDIGVRDGVIAAISAEPLAADDATHVVDAAGKWVTPGFIDCHTHYDTEVLVNPGLGESVRHGVTTVVMGSCSLSTILSGPEDAADQFSRVEAVPYDHVLATLQAARSWTSVETYVETIDALPLGPNVASFIGHSDLRAHVMGLGRSVDPTVQPSTAELEQMEGLLDDALDAGLLGLSTMTTKLDKVGGTRFRSRPLPSTHARWSEYRRLNRILRHRDRVLQSAPDARMPVNIVQFLRESIGWRRPALRTSLLVAADPKSVPGGANAGRMVAWCNRRLGSDVRLQHVPVPFELYSDGIDLPVFEELGAGRAALHLRDEVERNDLMVDESYRRSFRRQYRNKLMPGLWHKDLHDAEIVACPDRSVVGRSFGDVADERDIHAVDAFLDLIVEHGGANVRWRTTVANHRPAVLDKMASDPGIQIGFSDAGAHLRNMAFYNTGLRFLGRIRDAEAAGRPVLSIEHAVHRLTGELGAWFGLDAGFLRVGDRADLVVINPEALDDSMAAYHEEEIAAFGRLSRMVRRNDDAVEATCVAGRPVYGRGEFVDGYGTTISSGRFLPRGAPASRSVVTTPQDRPLEVAG